MTCDESSAKGILRKLIVEAPRISQINRVFDDHHVILLVDHDVNPSHSF